MKTAWDRRIIVSKVRKLAESAEFWRLVYISPDESLDFRRHNTLKRLKERYEREKEVKVIAGALFVDNVMSLCIRDGFPKRSDTDFTSHECITGLQVYLRTLNHNFSVIAVSETWASNNNMSLLNIPGYNSTFKNRTSGRGGGVQIHCT